MIEKTQEQQYEVFQAERILDQARESRKSKREQNMKKQTHVLQINFDITYEGEQLTPDRLDLLKDKILDVGILTMVSTKLESKAIDYKMVIQHRE